MYGSFNPPMHITQGYIADWLTKCHANLLPAAAAAGYVVLAHPQPRREMKDNGITAIPPGLFNFTTALRTLYGPWHAPVQAPRSPDILGTQLHRRSCSVLDLIDLWKSSVKDRAMFCSACRYMYTDRSYPLVELTTCHAGGPPPGCCRSRNIDNNAITAIPLGLFDFLTALWILYGRSRSISMTLDAHLRRHFDRQPS